jgi:hypothetical protein
MTAETPSRLGLRDRLRHREAAGGLAFALPLLLALFLMPLVGHGCHGDDVDHEPSTAPHNTQLENRP